MLDWKQHKVSVEPSNDEIPVSRWLVFRRRYTAVNPGPPVRAHVGLAKTVAFHKVRAGYHGG